jgi:hypothetical protein
MDSYLRQSCTFPTPNNEFLLTVAAVISLSIDKCGTEYSVSLYRPVYIDRLVCAYYYIRCPFKLEIGYVLTGRY